MFLYFFFLFSLSHEKKNRGKIWKEGERNYAESDVGQKKSVPSFHTGFFCLGCGCWLEDGDFFLVAQKVVKEEGKKTWRKEEEEDEGEREGLVAVLLPLGLFFLLLLLSFLPWQECWHSNIKQQPPTKKWFLSDFLYICDSCVNRECCRAFTSTSRKLEMK